MQNLSALRDCCSPNSPFTTQVLYLHANYVIVANGASLVSQIGTILNKHGKGNTMYKKINRNSLGQFKKTLGRMIYTSATIYHVMNPMELIDGSKRDPIAKVSHGITYNVGKNRCKRDDARFNKVMGMVQS